MEDTGLVSDFVKAFPVLGEIHSFEFTSDKSLLSPLYGRLPAPFPPLYEQLVLSYRWSGEVELRCLRLLANPGTSDFAGLTEQIFRDEGLVESLIPGGFVQFGKGPGVNYDPVCFDLRGRRRKDGDYRVVRLDHEEILCHCRIREVAELAPSFRELMLQIIAAAKSKQS